MRLLPTVALLLTGCASKAPVVKTPLTVCPGQPVAGCTVSWLVFPGVLYYAEYDCGTASLAAVWERNGQFTALVHENLAPPACNGWKVIGTYPTAAAAEAAVVSAIQ